MKWHWSWPEIGGISVIKVVFEHCPKAHYPMMDFVFSRMTGAREAGIFHHLITLPTYHTAALSTDNLSKEYFGDQGMLSYVKAVQRKEIREGITCVKHQNKIHWTLSALPRVLV